MLLHCPGVSAGKHPHGLGTSVDVIHPLSSSSDDHKNVALGAAKR